MGKKTRSVEENRKYQADRVAKVLPAFEVKLYGIKAKRLERWIKKHGEDAKPPRHIGAV